VVITSFLGCLLPAHAFPPPPALLVFNFAGTDTSIFIGVLL
jgi:hypothetical protein